MTLKFIGGGLILLAALSYLAYAGLKEGWVSYHLPVDEFVAKPQFHNQRVRLAGKVAEEDLVCNPGLLSARFILLGESQRQPVAYSGVIPDLFKAGCEVVVEGRRDPTGLFKADIMMTKCASKYEAAGHGSSKGGKAS